MATLVDIANYLDANVAGLTLGTNLFIGRMPDDPNACVAVYEYGGTRPDNTMGGGAPVLQNPSVQVRVRDTSYASAQTTANLCFVALEAIVDETINTTRYNRVTAIQSPFPLERDPEERIVFVQNFDVKRVFS
jgi:hypothetical protein